VLVLQLPQVIQLVAPEAEAEAVLMVQTWDQSEELAEVMELAEAEAELETPDFLVEMAELEHLELL
jgi:hypothetical protein